MSTMPNQKKRKKSKRSLPKYIHSKILPSGQIRFWADFGRDADGKQHWSKYYDTRNDAEFALTKHRIAKENEGLAVFDLTADQKSEARRCLKILEPYPYEGANLTNAVNHYVEHVLKFHHAPTIAKLIDELVERCKRNGRDTETVQGLRYSLKPLSETFGKRQLSSLTVPELQKFIDGMKQSSGTKTKCLTKVSQLYNYAIRNGWAVGNLTKRIDRPTVTETVAAIFTPDEASRLLEHAAKFKLLPYIAIGLFAGIRSKELQKLDWSAVKLNIRTISISAGIAKKRSQRTVEINDTLMSWIVSYAKASGQVTPVNGSKYILPKLAKEAGVKWKRNGLRHSFGSYHLAKFKNERETAHQMGHRDPDVLHNHYKTLVEPPDDERFWSLRPAGVAEGKVIPMTQAG